MLLVGGLGRSGSTLVEKLLNELPGAFAVGETIHLWERGIAAGERCGCGEPFASCPQWSAVGREAFGRWSAVDLDGIVSLRWSVDRTRRLPEIANAHRRGRPTRQQARYLDHLRRVLLAAAEVAGRPEVLVESSKHLSTAALLALDPMLDVRVVHLVRDPRGVAYSWTKRVERPEADGQRMPTYHPGRTAGRWVSDNLGFEALARRVPTLRLRYEDVLTQPAASLEAIAGLAGLDLDPPDLSFLSRSSSVAPATVGSTTAVTAKLSSPMHSVAGNPLRFGGDELTLRLDDAWRSHLPAADRRLVTTISAPLILRYGYPLRP